MRSAVCAALFAASRPHNWRYVQVPAPQGAQFADNFAGHVLENTLMPFDYRAGWVISPLREGRLGG